MYKLAYLPLAMQDIVEITRYIGVELCNPSAAEQLGQKLVQAAEELLRFPYSCPVYVPIRPLRQEYRKLLVEHYLILYYVDEGSKTVTVSRVIYAKRDYGRLLEP